MPLKRDGAGQHCARSVLAQARREFYDLPEATGSPVAAKPLRRIAEPI